MLVVIRILSKKNCKKCGLPPDVCICKQLEKENQRIKASQKTLKELLRTRPLQSETNDFGLDYWGCQKEVDAWFEHFNNQFEGLVAELEELINLPKTKSSTSYTEAVADGLRLFRQLINGEITKDEVISKILEGSERYVSSREDM